MHKYITLNDLLQTQLKDQLLYFGPMIWLNVKGKYN